MTYVITTITSRSSYSGMQNRLLVKLDLKPYIVGNFFLSMDKINQAPFFFRSLACLTSLVSILGAIAIAISSWKSNLHA